MSTPTQQKITKPTFRQIKFTGKWIAKIKKRSEKFSNISVIENEINENIILTKTPTKIEKINNRKKGNQQNSYRTDSTTFNCILLKYIVY
jgi:hypothetical protein